MTTLVKRESLARLAFDQSPLATIVLDQDAVIVQSNQAFAQLLLRTPGEVEGILLKNVLCNYAVEHFERFWDQAVKTSCQVKRQTEQLILKRGDDSPVRVGMEMQWTTGSLAVASFIDLTGHKFDDARLRAAVDAFPNGVVVFTSDGLIAMANKEYERIFGYGPNELMGCPIERLVPRHMQDQHRRNLDEYFRSPEARPMGAGRELYGVRKDGTEFPLEVGLTPIPSPNGLVILASVVDISLRRAMEAKLRDAQRMEAIGALASGIAHDFNNVLLAIHGYAELIHETPGLPECVQEDISQVLRGAERGREVVDRMLTVGRHRRDAASPIRLNGPVGEALDLLRASIPRSIEIRRHLDETPAVCCDGTQIHQIVMNLGANAAKAIHSAGGVIGVSLVPYHVHAGNRATHPRLQPGLYTRLTVTDDGVGMPADVQKKALEPFFTTRKAGEGTGLGLWLVNEIVQALGGIIELRSRPGEGTTFDIFFPACTEIPREEENADQAVPHIIYVDDERALADLGRRRLERAGYRVTTFNSATRALEELKGRINSFDLLITDNSMPSMSGLELAEDLVHLRPDLPVLLVSGVTKVRGESIPPFVSRSLDKPHTAEQLIDVVRSLIGPEAG